MSSLFLSAVFLVAFLAPLIYAYPMSYPYTDYNCICDHYLNEAYINTQYDEYTGTGLTGVYSNPTTYSSVQWWFNRGVGSYSLIPTGYMYCAYRFYPMVYDTTYGYSGNWNGPGQPFNGSYDGYYWQDYLMSGSDMISYKYGSTSSWFNAPFYPYDEWYCGGRSIGIWPSS